MMIWSAPSLPKASSPKMNTMMRQRVLIGEVYDRRPAARQSERI
jgi:hypothetical protein